MDTCQLYCCMQLTNSSWRQESRLRHQLLVYCILQDLLTILKLFSPQFIKFPLLSDTIKPASNVWKVTKESHVSHHYNKTRCVSICGFKIEILESRISFEHKMQININKSEIRFVFTSSGGSIFVISLVISDFTQTEN